MKKLLIKFSLFPFLLGSFFGLLSLADLWNLYFDKDIFVCSNMYIKTIAIFKNIQFRYAGDMDQIKYEGYGYISATDSIFVSFDYRNDQYFYEHSKVLNPKLEPDEYNDTKYHYIWYREGYKRAFPALPDEKEFPVWQRLHKRLWLFYDWLFCLAMTIIIWKIGVKMGFMEENKNKNED